MSNNVYIFERSQAANQEATEAGRFTVFLLEKTQPSTVTFEKKDLYPRFSESFKIQWTLNVLFFVSLMSIFKVRHSSSYPQNKMQVKFTNIFILSNVFSPPVMKEQSNIMIILFIISFFIYLSL